MAAASFWSCRGGGAGGSGAGGSGCTNWMLFDSILMLYNGVLLVFDWILCCKVQFYNKW